MVSNVGGSSGFAAAAKVLFDSAKKVGAVKPLGSTNKLYAQQLKRIQTQSRRRGGSLGSVSYSVVEFLESQRSSKAIPTRLPASLVKRVPLIDIPMQQSKKKEAVTQQKVPSKDIPNLEFIRKEAPRGRIQPGAAESLRAPSTSPSVGSLLLERVSPGPKKSSAKQEVHNLLSERSVLGAQKENEVFEAQPSECSKHTGEPKATVMEDKPLFGSFDGSETKTLPLLDPDIQVVMEKATRAVSMQVKPMVSVPISSVVASGVSEKRFDPCQGDTISVDVWELQRERELEQMRKDQEDAERVRVEIRREEEHKALGEEWVKSRKRGSLRPVCVNEVQSALENIYFSTGWEACLHSFTNLLTKTEKLSPTTSKQAIYFMERHLRSVPWVHRDAIKTILLKELKERRLHDDVVKFELRHAPFDDFLRLYRAVPAGVKESLDIPTTARTISVLVRSGCWLEAVEVFNESHQRFADKTGQLGLRLLSESHSLVSEAANAVSEHVSKTLTGRGQFGKLHSLQLIKLAKGSRKRNLISQLTASSDVDEGVYAELLGVTSKEHVKDILEEVSRRGLNAEDPAILAALCWKSFDVENPHTLFHEIQRQESIIGVRPAHILAAVAMARASKSEHVLRLTIQVLKKKPTFRCKFVLRKMLPLLHEKQMNSDIVDLAEIYGGSLCIATALPLAVGFINSALIAQGKHPLSDHLASDLDHSRNVSEHTRKGTAVGSAREKVLDSDVSTEAMLSCAKERDWLKALELLDSLPSQNAMATDSETLTLLYNCALSASVEKPNVVKSLYTRMVEEGVAVNATTSNALLGCFMRSSEWEESIAFYKGVDESLRDANTYSIMISLLGKNGKWKEAHDAFRDAQAGLTKVPPVIFTLGIGALHGHSWEATLSIFNGLVKIHGTSNVSESVIDKVVRCLTQNDRTTELRQVELEVSKAKAKSKGKKRP